MAGKYDPLHQHLAAAARRGDDSIQLRFDELDRLVGGLPFSARNYREWWSNSSQPHAWSWREAGWVVATVSQDGGYVRFERDAGSRPVSREAAPPAERLPDASAAPAPEAPQGAPGGALPPPLLTRFEKAAVDNGFDQELAPQGGWLGFGSTHAPLKVWLSTDVRGRPLAALSRLDVAQALTDHGAPVTAALPSGAPAARAVSDVPELHRLLRRAYQLARTLPNELLHSFEQQTAALPRTTEAERLVVQRVGQDLFRAGLMEYWEGRCAVTGLAVPKLLRASHIKPWAECTTDAERLDVFNGLLLAPNLDAAFDGGLITFADNGAMVIAQGLSEADRQLLGFGADLHIDRLTDAHRRYLSWHREREFKSS